MLDIIHDELYQQCGVDQLGRDDVIRNVVVNARVFLDVTVLRTAWHECDGDVLGGGGKGTER